MGDQSAIQVEGLRKTYREGFITKREVEALKGVTFEVDRGEIFGLLGPNGAGKTTFVKLLLGIIHKSGGEASVLGHDAGSRQARERIGYLPENLRMRRHHTAYTALEYYGQLSSVPLETTRSRGEELLKLVGLAERAKDGIRQYSKGMLQRLGLAQALLHEPDLLILDEPTDGLDPRARAEVREVLTKLKRERGTTIFLNSHILQEVEMICERVAILDRGELRYVGSVRDIGQHLASGMQQPAAQLPAYQAAQARPVGQTALQVDMELEGPGEAIRGIFASRVVQNFEHLSATEVRVAAHFSDQAAVDQCVDELRSAGVNIVGLSRRRVSLEAAFLEIVNEPNEKP